jgi:hypothetical protein
MDTDLEKIRRFSLTAALVLITYVVAGIRVEPNARVSPLGIPFVVGRSDLLPIGIALACFFSMLRFVYYGHMLGTSSYRRRRDLIDGLLVHSDERVTREGRPILGPFPEGKTIWMFWGARKFSLPVWDWDRGAVEKRAAAFDNAFPKFLWGHASATIVGEQSFDDQGEEYMTYNMDVVIPIRCRAAALLEDLDYSAPVWMNLFALWLYIRPDRLVCYFPLPCYMRRG